MAAINSAEGEATAIRLVAEANAEAIAKVAAATQTVGGNEAVNLKVAEKFVEAFGALAKQGNTIIIPQNVSDIAGMVTTALSVVKATNK